VRSFRPIFVKAKAKPFRRQLKNKKNRPFFLQGLGLDRPAAGLFNAPDEKTGKSRALGSPLMLE
jgi:hypothetical protein